MITATKNGITRNFSDCQWKNMPKDKFGWTVAYDTVNRQAVNPDIIQKKMTNGAVIVEKVVPDEIILTRKVDDIGGDIDKTRVLDPLANLPEIKRNQGGKRNETL